VLVLGHGPYRVLYVAKPTPRLQQTL